MEAGRNSEGTPQRHDAVAIWTAAASLRDAAFGSQGAGLTRKSGRQVSATPLLVRGSNYDQGKAASRRLAAAVQMKLRTSISPQAEYSSIHRPPETGSRS